MGFRHNAKNACAPALHVRQGSAKDQLLCTLELQQTLSAARINHLEKAAQELESFRDGFNALFERSPLGHLALDQRGHIQNANTAMAALMGCPRERLLHLPLSLLVPRDDVRLALNHIARCDKTHEPFITAEFRLRAGDQRLIPVQVTSVPYAAAGRRKMFLTTVADLTERGRCDQELAEAKEFAEAIVQTVRQPLCVLDQHLRIISANPAFRDFFRLTPEFFHGRPFEVLLNLWWSGNRIRAEFERILVRNQPLENFRIEVEPPQIGRRILLLNARRLDQRENLPHRILVAVEDVTDRELAGERLQKANEELEQRVTVRTQALEKSNQQMESFCYSIAHDLRAPLRTISGFSGLLEQEFGAQIGDTGKDFTERIRQGAERMDRLIQDLLQFGRLNTVNLPVETVNLEEVFTEARAQLDDEISGHRARIIKPQPLPLICGNRVVLLVTMMNLLSNAIKFVAKGTLPEITVLWQDQGSSVRVWVVDNGIGIDEKNHAKIFGVFQRLHPAEEYPGTGIGLALVSKGIERIGGHVGLSSALGKGSRFWIELKRAHPAG